MTMMAATVLQVEAPFGELLKMPSQPKARSEGGAASNPALQLARPASP